MDRPERNCPASVFSQPPHSFPLLFNIFPPLPLPCVLFDSAALRRLATMYTTAPSSLNPCGSGLRPTTTTTTMHTHSIALPMHRPPWHTGIHLSGQLNADRTSTGLCCAAPWDARRVNNQPPKPPAAAWARRPCAALRCSRDAGQAGEMWHLRWVQGPPDLEGRDLSELKIKATQPAPPRHTCHVPFLGAAGARREGKGKGACTPAPAARRLSARHRLCAAGPVVARQLGLAGARARWRRRWTVDGGRWTADGRRPRPTGCTGSVLRVQARALSPDRLGRRGSLPAARDGRTEDACTHAWLAVAAPH